MIDHTNEEIAATFREHLVQLGALGLIVEMLTVWNRSSWRLAWRARWEISRVIFKGR